MPPERGTYRGIYSSLPDNEDFQLLSPAARHVLLTMRIMREIGPGCIWRYYLGPIACRTGYTERHVEKCLAELETALDSRGRPARWIVREGPICWIRNGLKWDPTVKLNNLLHRNGVLRSLAELPRLAIVLEFCDYYNLPKPFQSPTQSPGKALSVPLANYPPAPPPSPSPSPSPSPKKTLTTLSSPAVEDRAAWPSPQALAEKYNREATDNCPAVTVLSVKRKEKAQRYLRMFPDESWWTVTFQQYHRSRFLSGKAPPANGHENFSPDFDWLLSTGKDGTENAVKVHDGRYSDAR